MMTLISRRTANNRASARAPPLYRGRYRGRSARYWVTNEHFLEFGETKAGRSEPEPEIPGKAQIPMTDLQAVPPFKPLDVKTDVFAERAMLRPPHYPTTVQIIAGSCRRE